MGLDVGVRADHVPHPAYTRGAMFTGLPAGSSYKLQTVGGQILAMMK